AGSERPLPLKVGNDHQTSCPAGCQRRPSGCWVGIRGRSLATLATTRPIRPARAAASRTTVHAARRVRRGCLVEIGLARLWWRLEPADRAQSQVCCLEAEDMVISRSAKGLATGEIAAHLAEVF